jgi:hypothetical protein
MMELCMFLTCIRNLDSLNALYPHGSDQIKRVPGVARAGPSWPELARCNKGRHKSLQLLAQPLLKLT